jgi:biopolymer transport protein ExbB/TolQ
VPVPDWVTKAVGVYALLGSVYFVLMAVAVAYGLYVVADLARQVRKLAGKVSDLTDRVQGIAAQVDTVTRDVGVRAGGLARMVDETATGAMRVVDFVAPVLILAGAFFRIRRWALGRRR